MNISTKEQIENAGLAIWYPKICGAEWTQSSPTTPGWYWFDSGVGNAGLFYIQKRRFKDEFYTKTFGKPPYKQNSKPNHYNCMKRFVGRWCKADPRLYAPWPETPLIADSAQPPTNRSENDY